MSLADATSIFVDVLNPDSPFGGVTVQTPGADSIQFEFSSNPAAVSSVFGRSGVILAEQQDYAAFYAPIGGGLPVGGTIHQVLTKISSASFDAHWETPSTGTAANPTGHVGLTAVNGVLTTLMRSDAAPPLDVSIAPTWTGVHTFSVSPLVPAPSGSSAAVNKTYVDAAVGGVALTKADDTNVTLTLTGNPTTALLHATQISAGWTGTLGLNRGGLGQSGLTIPAHKYFGNNTGGVTGADFVSISASEIAGGAALTKANDTNVTLTLTGSPNTSLLAATLITAGWTGTLGLVRGGLGQSGSSVSAHNYFGNNTGGTTGASFHQPSVADLSDGSTGTGTVVLATSPTLVTPLLGTPTSGNLANCTFPTLNQNTTGSAASLSISGQTGLLTVTGLASTNRIKTVRDAADTILELGGSYTPTGTWTAMNLIDPTGLDSTDVGLANVTNDVQTKASIVPNTAPSAGQLLAGNAGGTAYAPVTLSGSGATATLSSAGVLTLSAIANATLSNSTITIGGVSTALGGSALGNVTNDAQTKASIVPNTAPSAGQLLVGNAGGTAYAPATLSGSGATATLSSAGVLTLSAIANATLSNSTITIGGVSTALGGSALGNVTNDAQTKAAIVPNTAPSAGQILVGNAGGTAYAPVTVSGSGATITVASTGVHTISAIPNASLSNSAITIAGTSTSLGGTITLDTITGVSAVGFLKRTGANTLTNVATVTGWTAPTGSDLRTGYATSTVTLDQVAQTLKSLIADLFTFGVISA